MTGKTALLSAVAVAAILLPGVARAETGMSCDEMAERTAAGIPRCDRDRGVIDLVGCLGTASTRWMEQVGEEMREAMRACDGAVDRDACLGRIRMIARRTDARAELLRQSVAGGACDLVHALEALAGLYGEAAREMCMLRGDAR